MASSERIDNGGMNHHTPMVFQENNPLQFSHGDRGGGGGGRAAPDHHARKPRQTAQQGGGVGYGDGEMLFSRENRFFHGPPHPPSGPEYRRPIYRGSPDGRWNAEGSGGSHGGDGEGSDEDDDDEDDVDEGDGEVEGLVSDKNNNSSGSVQSSSEKNHGSNRAVQVKNGGVVHQTGRLEHYENAITVAEPDIYYAQMLQGGDGSAQKEVGGGNGCDFGGRNDGVLSGEPGDCLRTILSDPITGALMDDAVILPCGHSFGSDGIQHVVRMKTCFRCTQPVSEDLVRPNLALRSAVQAFCREEDAQSSKALKRRRERTEQDKCSYGDAFPLEFSRGKGVQFPFAVSDRVIIKGNKRTPQRFVGRTAVVTTQCLNGWYVVKTLDNAESVKLQYRSLAKVANGQASNSISNKAITPNWLTNRDMQME
ncbi:U-box domain-containing protein 62 [Acorus gramineus]|uniref:U-box domain-containing protein 62 n=1 Tax=Acorus gramineus TaxID=55184 RepID=A0AAV9B5A2_ACOGR|nr:U-box domain-containing protein 62 [Acorus gramineus]